MKENLIAYLRAYARKDLESVSDMFADDISLRDWKISVHGKQAAIAETSKNFQTADSIAIDVLHTYEAEEAVAAELRIVVDRSEVLHVVDVVSFTTEGKIRSIRAYLGRED